MDILIIGGTQFVGRALVEAALARNHNLTLFNRGKTNPGLFPQVEQISGNRDGEIDALGSRQWDAVIDTCGYVPRVVNLSAEYLADKVKRYVFISTISVYADTGEGNRAEDAPLATLSDETTEDITGETYGGLKVLCENVVQQTFGEGALIIRPGLIVGPHDPTNRFTYWPVRIRKGGRTAVPGQPDYPTQFIDVRDLAEWTIRMIEAGQSGIYNATGPDYRLTLGALFEACQQAAATESELVWLDDAFLQEHSVQPFMEMPLWIPGDGVEAFNTINIQKAAAAGLTFRALLDTIRDTLNWVDNVEEVPGRAGLSEEREAALLAAHQPPSEG